MLNVSFLNALLISVLVFIIITLALLDPSIFFTN